MPHIYFGIIYENVDVNYNRSRNYPFVTLQHLRDELFAELTSLRDLISQVLCYTRTITPLSFKTTSVCYARDFARYIHIFFHLHMTYHIGHISIFLL